MPDDQPSAILSFDFDGTLVDRPSDPYEIARLEQFLGHMQQRGAVWGINTGRTLFHTLDGLQEHGFKSTPDFIIARECELYHLNNVNRWADLGDWNQRCAADHRKFYKGHSKFFKRLRKFVEHEMEGAQFISDDTEPAGVVTHDEERMAEVCRWVAENAREWPELAYQRNSIWLRFTHCRYNKGTALTELRRLLNIGAEFTFAAGDNFNDLPMLDSAVAHGLACPANAVPEVLERIREHGGYAASQQATSGMIEAVQHYFYRDGTGGAMEFDG